MAHKLIAKVLAAGTACLLASTASNARSPYFALNFNSSTNTGWIRSDYLDYAAGSANSSFRVFSNIFTPNPGSVGARFYELYFYTVNATGQCFELRTGNASGAAADPKLWTRTGPDINGSFVAVADDVNGTQISARIWLKGVAGVNSGSALYLAAFNTAYNSMQLNFDFQRLEGLSEAGCTTNQTLPWVKFIGGVRTNGNYR